MEDDSSTLQTMNLLGARADAAQPRPWLIRRCSCAVAATLQRCPAPPTAVILTLDAMATVLALLAGTFPAVRAARLPAREAVGGG